VLQTGQPVVVNTYISAPIQSGINWGIFSWNAHLLKTVEFPADLNHLETNACLIIVDFNPRTLQLLKDWDTKQRYIIPAPWLSFKQRQHLLQTAVQLKWNVKDPKKSGWFYMQ